MTISSSHCDSNLFLILSKKVHIDIFSLRALYFLAVYSTALWLVREIPPVNPWIKELLPF